jgi:hypothetical protein
MMVVRYVLIRARVFAGFDDKAHFVFTVFSVNASIRLRMVLFDTIKPVRNTQMKSVPFC